jgi:drug/metabolite transporter (DMT)-like permease
MVTESQPSLYGRNALSGVGEVPSSQAVLPVAGILTGALVWGLIWFPFRVLQENGFSGPTATLITYVVAMLCGAFMFPRAARELPRAGWWAVGLVLSAGWANLGYVLGMLHGEVMRVLLLFYLAPLWTIVLSYWLLGEELTLDGYLIMALSLGGALIMLWKQWSAMPLPHNVSEWIGLSAGISFALSSVISRRAISLSIEAKTSGVLFGTAMLAAPVLWWQGSSATLNIRAVDAETIVLFVTLGMSLCAAAYAVQYGLVNLVSNRAMLLFLIELAVAATSSYFLAGEAMQPHEWVGAVLIVLASILFGSKSMRDDMHT